MPISSDELPWEDLGRWFAGELSGEDAAALERWVASEPERVRTVAALREAWTSAGVVGEGWDATAALRRVRQAAADDVRVIARLGGAAPTVTERSWRWLAPALRAAAAIAVVVGGGFLALRRTHNTTTPVPVAMAEYRTAAGQRLSLRLADGTQVVLAPGSVLRRPADYGRSERRLELEGQAYFVVTHDEARPFTVRTDRFVARDIGTRFDIVAYRGEDAAEVVVAEGSVAVEGVAAPVTLVRGQRARLDAGGRLAVESGVDLERRFAWTEGRLVFADTPLADVARQLARWYDVDVRLDTPALARLRVTGAFGDESVVDVLGAVARSLDLDVRRERGGYLLASPRS